MKKTISELARVIQWSSQISEELLLELTKRNYIIDKSILSHALKDALTRWQKQYLAQLSEREKDVVYEFLRGETPQQMAYRLGMSTRAIRWHRRRIQKKWSCENHFDWVWHLSLLRTGCQFPLSVGDKSDERS